MPEPSLSCPNCGVSAPAAASECRACGIVFLKWRARASVPSAASAPAVTKPVLAAWALLTLGFFLAREPLRRALFVLDGVDLIIHEAGHPIFGLLGNRFLMMAGGTLLQLIMPLAFWWDFRRRDQPRSSDACLFWVGQNFLHIGRYAADARAQELPLVGGGEHDWTYLLEVAGLLTRDIGVGRTFDFVGCALMAWALAAIVRKTRAVSRA